MKYTFLAKFSGRLCGAIGIFYPCEVRGVVEADNEKDALDLINKRVYETHEHCTHMHVIFTFE